jgi:hypothetical protein
MMTQLTRQLELNIAALSRGFRQALRHAQKTDPQGTAETSPAWKTVADRQAMLLTMLAAAAPFLQPRTEAPAPTPPPAAIIDTPREIEDPAVIDDESADEGCPSISSGINLAILPPDIRELHEKMVEIMNSPTKFPSQRARRLEELGHLQDVLENKLRALGINLPALPSTG